VSREVAQVRILRGSGGAVAPRICRATALIAASSPATVIRPSGGARDGAHVLRVFGIADRWGVGEDPAGRQEPALAQPAVERLGGLDGVVPGVALGGHVIVGDGVPVLADRAAQGAQRLVGVHQSASNSSRVVTAGSSGSPRG
jgi:hypothetical protein